MLMWVFKASVSDSGFGVRVLEIPGSSQLSQDRGLALFCQAATGSRNDGAAFMLFKVMTESRGIVLERSQECTCPSTRNLLAE